LTSRGEMFGEKKNVVGKEGRIEGGGALSRKKWRISDAGRQFVWEEGGGLNDHLRRGSCPWGAI